MIQLFLSFEFGKIAKYFSTRKTAKLIVSFLFLLVFIFVALGIYGFFVTGLRFISLESEEDMRAALSLFLYESFLLILSLVVIVGTLITSLFSLFLKKENTWIIASPKFSLIPFFTLWRSITTSSFPILIFFLPILAAMVKIFHLPLYLLLLPILSLVLVAILLPTLTISFVLIFSYVVRKVLHVFSVRLELPRLIGVLLLLASSLLVYTVDTLRKVDFVRLFRANDATDILSPTIIGEHFYLAPTHHLSLLLLDLSHANHLQIAKEFGLITLFTVLSLLVFWKASSLFFVVWKDLQENSKQKVNTLMKEKGYTFKGSATYAIAKKEFMVLTRDMKGLLSLLFLLSLWICEITMNTLLKSNYLRHASDITQRIAILESLQYAIALYFIAAFTLRFVFPSFSMEKGTFWILGSSPLSFRKLFLGKYIFYTLFFMILGLCMSTLGSLTLGIQSSHALYFIPLFLSTILGVVTLALTLGTLFPNKESSDPEIISTSMPGLFFTGLAILYASLSTYILYFSLRGGDVIYFALFIPASIFISLLLVTYTVKKKRSFAF